MNKEVEPKNYKQKGRLKGIKGKIASGMLVVTGAIAFACDSQADNPQNKSGKEVVSGCPTQPLSDQNLDGIIDIADAIETHGSEILSDCPVAADVAPSDQPDGKVDELDQKVIQNRLGLSRSNPSADGFYYSPQFDPNRDGKVDENDLEIVIKHQGKTVPTGAFSLDKPQELAGGYASRELIISFSEDSSVEQRSSILSQHNLTQIGDGGRPHIVQASTESDDLDSLTQEIKEKHSEVNHIDKHLFGGGPNE